MKIALWLELNWAFGRFAEAVKQHSRHEIGLFSWECRYNPADLEAYDLIFTPVWFTHAQFCRLYPSVTKPVAYSVRGIAELFNFRLANFAHRSILKEEVEAGQLSEGVVWYFNNQKAVGCASWELMNLLRPQVNCDLLHAPCGVDLDEFYKPVVANTTGTLNVLCPFVPSQPTTAHGYDVKRWRLIYQIRNCLSKEAQNKIKFLTLPHKLPTREMAAFYQQGDIILCLSHSEGNPYSLMEAGAAGAIPLSTVVGIAPELIAPGYNGQLLYGQDDKALVCEAASILETWAQSDPYDLLLMRRNYQNMICATRGWESVIPKWDDFFERMLT